MRVRLKASISLIIVCIVFHLLAVYVMWILPIALILKCLSAISLSISLFRTIRYAGQNAPDSLIELGKEGKTWWAVTPDAELHRLRILPDTVVTSHIICFHAKNEQNKRLKALIFSWELEPACFRKLCVSLRIQ